VVKYRQSNVKLYIDETELEIVRHYKYLGIMLSLNGSFTQALLDLTRRGQKAFFKLKNIFNVKDQGQKIGKTNNLRAKKNQRA
jgi:hypothetical protein